MLVLLDTELQFVVEDDALDSMVGVVFSQPSPSDQKLYLCAFLFFRSLTPVEGIYGVGNRKLLAIAACTPRVATLAGSSFYCVDRS